MAGIRSDNNENLRLALSCNIFNKTFQKKEKTSIGSFLSPRFFGIKHNIRDSIYEVPFQGEISNEDLTYLRELLKKTLFFEPIPNDKIYKYGTRFDIRFNDKTQKIELFQLYDTEFREPPSYCNKKEAILKFNDCLLTVMQQKYDKAAADFYQKNSDPSNDDKIELSSIKPKNRHFLGRFLSSRKAAAASYENHDTITENYQHTVFPVSDEFTEKLANFSRRKLNDNIQEQKSRDIEFLEKIRAGNDTYLSIIPRDILINYLPDFLADAQLRKDDGSFNINYDIEVISYQERIAAEQAATIRDDSVLTAASAAVTTDYSYVSSLSSRSHLRR